MRQVRKRLGSILLTVAMLLSLLPMTAEAAGITIYVGPNTTGIQDGTQTNPYTDLVTAMANAADGDTVQLMDDLEIQLNDTGDDADTCDQSLWFDQENITLDLGGCTLTTVSNFGGSYNVLNVFGTGWTVKNGTIIAKRTDGTADSYAIGVEIPGGTFVLDNVSLSGGIAFYATVDALLKDTQIGTTQVAATNYYCVYGESGAHITIEGGTYTSNGTKPVLYAEGAWTSGGTTYPPATMEIIGGDFEGTIFATKAASSDPGTLTIYGGTFSSAVDPKYCADGFVPQDNGGGSYGVKSLFTSGTGTEQDPFVISSETDLNTLRDSVAGGTSYAGKYFELGTDIPLAASSWTPIGSQDKPFSGTFDGAGKTISDMTITAASGYSGFFGSLSGARVKDLTIANADITCADDAWVGVLAGRANSSTITGCSVSSEVKMTSPVQPGTAPRPGLGAAGVVEYLYQSTVSGTNSAVNIS